MAHLLVIELPGGNDTDIIESALRLGHSFAFLTQSLDHYRHRPEVFGWIEQATTCIECKSFAMDELTRLVWASHRTQAFDAILCLIDIRLIEAAVLAESMGLRHLNSKSARLLRDKFSVRESLRQHGLSQPEFRLATSNEAVGAAIESIGLPLLIKPCDGYGSQNILTLETDLDLSLAQEHVQQLLPLKADYGLGVQSNDRLLVERYMRGKLIGCDVFTQARGSHRLLGVNEKLMFEPPSFAIRGGCFLPNQGQWPELESYVFRALDAVGFDLGASHIEVMLTQDGPQLVEINPRLVGAKIARLMGCSLGQSVHDALIRLHLGQPAWDGLNVDEFQPAVTRWLVATDNGRLERIELPTWRHQAVRSVELLVQPGQQISLPFENAHRLGCVITCASSRDLAEQVADRYWADTHIVMASDSMASPLPA